MTIREAFSAYRMDVIIYRNQSRKTEENHQIVQRNLINFFGDIEMEHLTFPMIRNWKLDLDKTRSPETVRNYIIKLRVVLTYLKSRGYNTLDPEAVSVPKRSNKAPVCITADQVVQLIAATPELRCKSIISLLYASGIRVSELCALNRDQLRDGRFTITGKGGKSRLCFYDARTARLLAHYLEHRADSHPALFYTPQGRIKPGTVQDLFKRLRKRTGIENIHPHTLRHSYATNLMQNGMHIYTLARLLGHSNIQTTEMYLHVTDPQLEKEYNTFHSI